MTLGQIAACPGPGREGHFSPGSPPPKDLGLWGLRRVTHTFGEGLMGTPSG